MIDMEEDRLKYIFRQYDPDLSSSVDFLKRLERNLNVVEMIHQENAKAAKRNRIALMLASLAGFTVGFLFSLTLPYIDKMAIGFRNSIISQSILHKLDFVFEFQYVIVWIIIGAISVIASLVTYNMALNYRPLTNGKQAGLHP